MTQLVVMLSTGKGSWAHVAKLISQSNFDDIIIITNSFGKEKFTLSKPHTMIVADFDTSLEQLESMLQEQLKPVIKGTQVGLNMVSGTGKEHMALLSALLKTGVGVRLVVAGENDFKEL